jgi:hypothetical protein
MKKIILIGSIFTFLISCKKNENFIYKYQYTTTKSQEYKKIVSSLSNYDHQLNSSEIESERIFLRSSKENLFNEKVLNDTLIFTNY